MKKTKKSLKNTAKNRKILILSMLAGAVLALLAVLLILAISLGWFKGAGGAEGTGAPSAGDYATSWEETHTNLNGRYESIFASDGTEKTLVIDFGTESGEIDIMVYEKDSGYALDIDGTPAYYVSVGNASYEIPYTEDVVVRLDARSFCGSFSIRVR